jgi:putative alpha-1,2-mannosidase
LEARKAEVIEVRVATSVVSIGGAWKNLEAEGQGRGFDEIRRAAKATWNRCLGKVEVEGGSSRERRVFYSAL